MVRFQKAKVPVEKVPKLAFIARLTTRRHSKRVVYDQAYPKDHRFPGQA